MPRAEQSLSLAEPDVEEEWRELIEVMEAFWQRFLPSIYPNDPNGPFLVSLQSRRDLNAAVLNALREKGPAGSPRRSAAKRWTSCKASGCSCGGSVFSASSVVPCAQGIGRPHTTTKRWGAR